jgi:hypothetical protein
VSWHTATGARSFTHALSSFLHCSLPPAIADLETSSENVRTENATIAHVTDAKLDADAMRRRDGARAKCMAAEEDLNAAARSSELEMEEQSRSIAFYRRLGLRFDCLEGEQLKLTFTQIDAAEPTREFIIAVSVDDGDVYRVMQCAPEVELLDALVTELNATNNFSLFVQALRRSFVALAAAQVEEE